MIDVLPEEWAGVAYNRYRLLRDATLKNMFKGFVTMEGCVDCPCMDAEINGNYVVIRCIVNKCIKQYPHISDNKEFT